MIGIPVPRTDKKGSSMFKSVLDIALKVSQLVCYVVLAGMVGYIIGDEIHQRVTRMKLRDACYAQSLERAGGQVDEFGHLVITFQCRNAIP